MHRSALRQLAAGGLAAALLALAPVAQGRGAANLSLQVTFFANGQITVTQPDGTPVGSSSGSPTVIPAGFYWLLMSSPGGCSSLPHFLLKGPGENIVDNMNEGEDTVGTHAVFFQPNSTYTWVDDAFPGVVYSFRTSGSVDGAAPAATPSGLASSKHTTGTSKSLVGSAAVPFRGTLTGAVSPSGHLTLVFKGKPVTSLKPGRYTVAVTDRSSKDGFVLLSTKKRAVSVTGSAFVGKRSASVHLTAGKWFFTPHVLGKLTGSIAVG